MDKEQLLKPRLREIDVEVEDGTVRVRAVSHDEAISIKDKSMPVDVMEQKLLAIAMVDPEMSEQDIAQWQKASPAGEIHKVFEAVAEMSGMQEVSAKQAYKSI